MISVFDKVGGFIINVVFLFIFGIVMFGFLKSYIFWFFGKVMFLVIGFGFFYVVFVLFVILWVFFFCYFIKLFEIEE